MAKNLDTLPLYEETRRKNTLPRAVELLILFLLLSLLIYRVFCLDCHGFPWMLALLCESWFTFIWFLDVSIKWTQFNYKTYPQRLLQRVSELPRVDLFVTTADPILEPAILTMNTVLSLLAVDYPSGKLACYLSDDGCSPITFYSLVETSKFANIWVPFCKKYDVSVRAPFRYFTDKSSLSGNSSVEVEQEWNKTKDEYDKLCKKIEKASKWGLPFDFIGEYEVFADAQPKNHPTILKVILENKGGEVPNVVYISREKRPKYPHYFKAGAMNILTRVSGMMTNGEYMLNVDCDMFVNNPKIILHAMCFFLGAKSDNECGFVQCPQKFYDGIKDDPFGNQMVVLNQFMLRGIAAAQGPFYAGTGCFHRRKVIYGLAPNQDFGHGNLLSDLELEREFGRCMEFRKSAASILFGTSKSNDNGRVEAAAIQVSGCAFEYGTAWGKQIGWIYGSTTEDILTGLIIHGRGWRSEYLDADQPGFLGCAPSGGPASTTQMKRWSTGLLEVLFSSRSPLIFAFTAKLEFRQCLSYLWLLVWALRSIPEISYAVLPAYCIISDSSFLPKLDEAGILQPISIFGIYNLYTLYEYLQTGSSVRAWWNNQRMWRVNATSSWLFGLLSVILKYLGLSQTVFEVTQKVETNEDENNSNAGRYTFDESPLFISGTTILLVNLAALATMILGFRQVASGGDGVGMAEVLSSAVVVVHFWSFFKGLFGKGKYGIPFSTILKAGALSFLFFSSFK